MHLQINGMLVCLAGFLIACSGCNALHVPQSEIMLFEKHRDPDEAKRGFSASSASLRDGFRQYAVSQHTNTRRMDLLNRSLWSFVYKQGYRTRRLGAIGVALGGSGVGLDWTYSIRDQVYLTAIGNIHQSYSFIVQHPVARYTGGGLGIGLYIRSDRHGLSFCDEVLVCETDHYFRVTSYGVRLAHYIDDEKGRLRSRLWLGYAPEMNAVVFAVGLGISAKP